MTKNRQKQEGRVCRHIRFNPDTDKLIKAAAADWDAFTINALVDCTVHFGLLQLPVTPEAVLIYKDPAAITPPLGWRLPNGSRPRFGADTDRLIEAVRAQYPEFSRNAIVEAAMQYGLRQALIAPEPVLVYRAPEACQSKPKARRGR